MIRERETRRGGREEVKLLPLGWRGGEGNDKGLYCHLIVCP